MNQLSEDKRTLVLYLLGNGEGVRQTARLARVSPLTVASLRDGILDDMNRPPRGPGRPPLPEGEDKGKIVPVRFTEDEHRQLREYATSKGFKTLSEWIRTALTKEAKNGSHSAA